MKKFLLSMAALAFAGIGAFAAPVVVDFSSSEDLPTDDATTAVQTTTINGVDLSFFHCKKGTYSGISYIQLSGKNYKGDDASYMEFKTAEPVSKFRIHTNANASANVCVTLTCNGTEVPRYVSLKLDQKDADFDFEIPSDMQAAGTVYRLTTSNAYNSQITVVTLNPDNSITPTPEPEPEPEPDPTPSETTDLNVKDATDLVGTLIDETYKTDGSVQAAKHYAPIESLAINGYSFTFTKGTNENTDPAYYYPTSTSTNGKESIRLYKGNTMTITAPAGVTFTSLVSVPDNSSTETTLYKGEEVNSYTFTATATTRINIVKVGSGEPSEPEVVDVPNSIAETIALKNDSKVKVNYPLLVALVKGKNCFVRDNAGDFIQIYGENSYKADDIIPAGWEATYTLYNGKTPELVPVSLPESTEQGTFIPERYEASQISEALVNHVLVVTNVAFEEATPAENTTFTGNSGDATLTFYNNYKLESVAAGSYDINCVVMIFKGEVQLYPLNYFKADDSGVEEIATEDGIADYYTLQGVKVANPTEGLYIVVKNGKANKVLVK